MRFYYDAYIVEWEDVLDFKAIQEVPNFVIHGLNEEEAKFLSEICIRRRFGIFLIPHEKQ